MTNEYIIQTQIDQALNENHERIRQRLIHDYNHFNEIKNNLPQNFETMILTNIIDNIYKTLEKNGVKFIPDEIDLFEF